MNDAVQCFSPQYLTTYAEIYLIAPVAIRAHFIVEEIQLHTEILVPFAESAETPPEQILQISIRSFDRLHVVNLAIHLGLFALPAESP